MKSVTVTQVNEYIAQKLRQDFNLKGLVVEGEVSGLSKSGPHYYLTLKDSDSFIKCAIWGSNAKNIDMNILENGKKIVVVADISPYPKSGSYSLSIRHIEIAGEGELMAEFNRVKDKLQAEGLFDQKYKRPICQFPKRIGIITSSTGAAIEDIKKIITAKNNYTNILIFPTLVQGVGAVSSIINNINLANKVSTDELPIDTLIVGRGGGSAEDLAAFNDEELARTIFDSQIPIISAVGHESDFSISDFVADLRAETPTAAADIAVMNTFQLKEDIDSYKKQILESTKLKIQAERQLLDLRIDNLNSSIMSKIVEARNLVEQAIIRLNENNPSVVLSKGYSVVLDNGKHIPDITEITIDKEYQIKMRDGCFIAKAISVERNE